MVRLLTTTLMSTFVIAGCSRPVSKSALSSVSIKIPQALGTLGAFPVGRKACFGVSVTADDIKNPDRNSCNPPIGIHAGYVAAGGLLELDVPKGKYRKIELYALILNAGDNGPCPKLGPNMSVRQVANTYLVASVPSVNMLDDVTTVEITPDFPGLTNTVAQQQSLASNCDTTGTNPQNTPGFFTSGGFQTATATGTKMITRMARPVGRQSATGGGMRMITQ